MSDQNLINDKQDDEFSNRIETKDDELEQQETTPPLMQEPNSIFDKIIEFITGFTSDERIKIRKLKEINKKLKHLKFSFYNYKKDQILPAFGNYLYELYRMCQNISKFMDTKKHYTSIKQFIFEMYSTDKQKKLKYELEREHIDKAIKSSINPKEAINKVKKNIKEYIHSFDHDMIKKINSTYNQIADISNIVNFDWFFLVHKFDSEITETNFNYKPDFEPIEGKYVIDEIITINDYLETIDFNKDFKNVIEYIKTVSDDEGHVSILRNIIKNSKTLKKNEYLFHLVRLIQKDPFFKPQTFPNKAKVVQDYIYNFQVEIQQIVNRSLKELKKSKIDRLLMDIFHKTAIVRLKHYSDRLNDLMIKKSVVGFKHIEPLNYLKAFLLDFCKGEIKPRIDSLLIKGTWSTHTLSSEYSSLLEQFNKLSDKILEFDEQCSEDERYGKSIRKLVFAVKHDPNALSMLKKTVYKVDSEATQLLFQGINLFLSASTKIRELIDDANSKSSSIIVDIDKIKWDFNGEIVEELSEILRKLNNFNSLLRTFVKESKEEPKKK